MYVRNDHWRRRTDFRRARRSVAQATTGDLVRNSIGKARFGPTWTKPPAYRECNSVSISFAWRTSRANRVHDSGHIDWIAPAVLNGQVGTDRAILIDEFRPAFLRRFTSRCQASAIDRRNRLSHEDLPARIGKQANQAARSIFLPFRKGPKLASGKRGGHSISEVLLRMKRGDPSAFDGPRACTLCRPLPASRVARKRLGSCPVSSDAEAANSGSGASRPQALS